MIQSHMQKLWSNLTRQTFVDGKARTGNMGLASCGVKCLKSSAVFQINFSAGLTVLCPEIPHERQAQNRSAKYSLRSHLAERGGGLVSLALRRTSGLPPLKKLFVI